MKWIVWDEPYEDDYGLDYRTCRLTPGEAISRQRAASKRARGKDVYDEIENGDQRALQDFIDIHWAWEE